jgi:hypothetical protein
VPRLYRFGRTVVLLAALCGAGAGALAAADFAGQAVPPAVRTLADWAVDTADHTGRPFIVVDKVSSAVFVFDGTGRLQAAAPALLGLARGDDTVPGIGARALSTIRPDERTTPAGRFTARLDLSLKGEEILWVDYESAVALHPVITSNPKEHRLQRLASAKPADRRITYGCINVAAAFFEKVVAPAFRGTEGIVYVLPETRRPRDVFGWRDGGG